MLSYVSFRLDTKILTADSTAGSAAVCKAIIVYFNTKRARSHR